MGMHTPHLCVHKRHLQVKTKKTKRVFTWSIRIVAERLLNFEIRQVASYSWDSEKAENGFTIMWRLYASWSWIKSGKVILPPKQPCCHQDNWWMLSVPTGSLWDWQLVQMLTQTESATHEECHKQNHIRLKTHKNKGIQKKIPYTCLGSSGK